MVTGAFPTSGVIRGEGGEEPDPGKLDLGGLDR